MTSLLQNSLLGSFAVPKMSRSRSFTRLAAVASVAVILCLGGLTVLFQEASAGYGPPPHFGGGRFGPGRGPVHYGPGGRPHMHYGPGFRGPVPYGPGRYGPHGHYPGHFHGPGGFRGGGPGPVIMPSHGGPHGGPGHHRGPPSPPPPPRGGPHGGPHPGGPVDFSSASHWSNFGSSQQYPSVPMGNIQGQPGTPSVSSEQLPSAEAAAEDTSSSGNNLFNYMTQDEEGLSNQAPSSNTWYDSGAGGSSEPAVAEGMGIEDAPGDEREPEEVKDANSPKESSSSNDFLAVRVEESKKEQQEKADALKEEALKAKKKALREALERRRAKKAEEKREEELKKEEEKEEAKKEDAKESEADESLDREEPAKEETEEEREEGGSHKLKSHKKESHEEESHKEESHEEEHSSA